ncbi:hypothetical protein [Massilia varians]|uniref:hypothetical protein n=1 Tax=Massilia varians TaxID=457921 RepID=UPI0025546845|nr:hypothetical protein [Massilia varians]MDK6080571.1 hypothetical protein [Massilia varians]
MTFNFSLKTIDRIIVIVFAVAVAPIFYRLGHPKYSISLHLGHFADMLAVLAAVYAGRTAFFKNSTVFTVVRRRHRGIQNDAVNTTAGAVSGSTDKVTSKNNATPQESVETPQRVFAVMVFFLLVYVFIRCIQFLTIGEQKPVSDFIFGISLLFLMALFVTPFTYFAFSNAIKEQKNVFFRFLLGLILPISAALIGMLWLAVHFDVIRLPSLS